MGARIAADGFRSDVAGLKGTVDGLRSAFDMLDQCVERIGNSAAAAAGGLRSAFNQVDDAAKETLQSFDQLKEFASSNAFDLSVVLRAAQQLKTLRLSADETIPVLREVAKVLAASGRGTVDLERLARALGEVAVKGRLYSEEINQLGNAGVPVWELLAHATGKSREELSKLVKQGKVTADFFISEFRAFAAGIPDAVLATRTAVAGLAETTGELERKLRSLSDKTFELSGATSAGRTELERFNHWIETLAASGDNSESQLSKLKGTIDAVRRAAVEADAAEKDHRQITKGESLVQSVVEINRELLRQSNDLSSYQGNAKPFIDQVMESFERLKEIKVPPGTFLSLIRLLEELHVASADDVQDKAREIGAAIGSILRPFSGDLAPEQVGAAIRSMVESIRLAYEVTRNQLTPVQLERNRLDEESARLQLEAGVAAETAAQRYRNAWLSAINEVQLADLRATESIIASQVRIADQGILHPEQERAQVLEFMARQKGLTEIAADAKIGAMQKTFDGIDSVLDRVIPKLHGFGDLLKQIIGDLLKLELSKAFQRVLGVNGETGNGGNGGSGGGLGGFLNMFKGVGGGGGNQGGGGLFGSVKSLLGFGGGGTATTPAVAGAISGGGGLMSGLGGASAFAAPSALGLLTGGGAAAATGGAAALAGGASAFAAPSAIAALGGGGAAAGAIAALGGGGAAAGAGGAAAGGAAGGASGFGALVPLLTNPWTIGIAAAAVGGILLWRHFQNGTEKALRKSIQAEYGIDVKDMQVLKQVKELGEQGYGKGNVSKHLTDVVRLEPVKELLQQYAMTTGQTSSKLVTNAQFQDPAFAGNQFVRRIAGGLIPGQSRGFDHVPLLADGGEFVLPSRAVELHGVDALNALNRGSAEITPRANSSSTRNTSGPGDGGMSATIVAGALQMVAAAVDRLQKKLAATRPGDVFSAAIDENPSLGAKALNKSADASSGELQTALKKMGFARG